MVVRTYFNLGRVHEEAVPIVPPVIPLAPENFLGVLLGQLLGPPGSLPNFQMEPMSPRLPSVEDQPAVPVIELSSTATP